MFIISDGFKIEPILQLGHLLIKIETMKIKIHHIEHKDSQTIVTFSSDVGNGAGIWVGSGPEINNLYAVELDVEDPLIPGENLFVVDHENFSPGFEMVSTGMKIRGVIDSVDEGIIVVRIGGSLLMCAASPEGFSPGTKIELHTSHILIHDENL